MSLTEKLTPGIIKICSGLLESCSTEPYKTNIAIAERIIVTDCGLNNSQEVKQKNVINAIKLNLINRKENSLDNLLSLYNIDMKKSEFREEQNRFCYTLATLCGFI
ncbi:MAG: hypothetical protein RSD67_05445 [Oscillospiraceae bacterium]